MHEYAAHGYEYHTWHENIIFEKSVLPFANIYINEVCNYVFTLGNCLIGYISTL